MADNKSAKGRAQRAIEEIFSNTKVSKTVTREDLEEILVDLEEKIAAVGEDEDSDDEGGD
jgi:hypothetical protein